MLPLLPRARRRDLR
ncbi:hypothetical protein LZF96_22820 [Streptomyces sp. ST2-7A]|nr:hypothetical protein [Streptomyces sp. ST2-7A]